MSYACFYLPDRASTTSDAEPIAKEYRVFENPMENTTLPGAQTIDESVDVRPSVAELPG